MPPHQQERLLTATQAVSAPLPVPTCAVQLPPEAQPRSLVVFQLGAVVGTAVPQPLRQSKHLCCHAHQMMSCSPCAFTDLTGTPCSNSRLCSASETSLDSTGDSICTTAIVLTSPPGACLFVVTALHCMSVQCCLTCVLSIMQHFCDTRKVIACSCDTKSFDCISFCPTLSQLFEAARHVTLTTSSDKCKVYTGRGGS